MRESAVAGGARERERETSEGKTTKNAKTNHEISPLLSSHRP
jgi:hypothetical protein